jgi:hypothetical protein
MDKQTDHILRRITRGVPRHLADHVTKEVVDTDSEERVQRIIADSSISMDARRKMQRLLDNGAFRKTHMETDEKVIKEIDHYHTKEIASAKKTGRLADPMTDKFYADRMRRLERGDVQKQVPMTEEEKKAAARKLTLNRNSGRNS